MALIIIEGLDRTGKTTVARQFEAQGYEYVHQSAPPKGQTVDVYLEEQVALVSSAAHKNIVLDRSFYGEIGVWPKVYGRESLLSADDLEVLRELETQVGTTRILMHDPDVEKHWQRCVKNNEPLTRAQFAMARKLFYKMADDYGFEKRRLDDFTALPKDVGQIEPLEKSEQLRSNVSTQPLPTRTKEQQKLEVANAINDVLSKRILKPKGPIYDQLESSIRTFLNSELGKIFGASQANPSTFSVEEVELLKFFCNKLKAGK